MSDPLQEAVRLHRAGQLAEAAQIYSAILGASPRRFETLYFLGFLRFQRGELTEAERLLTEAVRVNPASPDAHYNRGCVLQQLQRHGEAVSAFDKALLLKPDYADAAVNRGVALMALNRLEEALAAFDRGLALNPRDAEALSNRGAILFGFKRYGEATAAYRRILAVTPEFPYALGSLALCRAYCCDWKDYAKDAERLHAAVRAGKSALAPHAATLISGDPDDQLRSARRWVSERCPPPVASVAGRTLPAREDSHRVPVVRFSCACDGLSCRRNIRAPRQIAFRDGRAFFRPRRRKRDAQAPYPRIRSLHRSAR